MRRTRWSALKSGGTGEIVTELDALRGLGVNALRDGKQRPRIEEIE